MATFEEQLKGFDLKPYAIPKARSASPPLPSRLPSAVVHASESRTAIARIRTEIARRPFEDLKQLILDSEWTSEFANGLQKLITRKIAGYEKDLAAAKRELASLGTLGDEGSGTEGVVTAIKERVKLLENVVTRGRVIDTLFFKKAESSEVKRKRDAVGGWIGFVRSRLKKAVYDPEDGIASLLGEARADARDSIAYLVRSLASGPELFEDSFFNVVCTGPAGSGKTKVAKVIAFVMSNLLILFREETKVLTAADLIAGFEGQTQAKVRSALLDGVEKVVFIDEAYSLAGCDPQTNKTNAEGDKYGAQAVTEIVNFLDKFRGKSMMIVAGYEGVMLDCFLKKNEGLSRRFPDAFRISLHEYSSDDLYQLLIGAVRRTTKSSTSTFFYSDVFSPIEWHVLREVIRRVNEMKQFENQAGDVDNLSTSILGAIGIDARVFRRSSRARSVDAEMAVRRLLILEQGVNRFIQGKKLGSVRFDIGDDKRIQIMFT